MTLHFRRYSALLAAMVLALPATSSTQSAKAGTYTSIEEASEHAETATTLILDKVPLHTLPPSIANLTHLRVLILHRNNLKAIPNYVDRLKNLEAVYVGGSPDLDFSKVIQILARLRLLEGIGLDDNNMRTVPANIGLLKTCKRLGLSSNNLTSLPPEIGDLDALESLDIYNNNLKGNAAEGLRSLKKLKKLFVKDSGLAISSLSAELPAVQLIGTTPPELYLQLK